MRQSMRKPAILLLFVCTLAASAAHAATYSDTYVIPVVGHTIGANGTTWMSDLAIRNISNSSMDVQLVVVESGENTTDNVFPLVTDDLDGFVTVGPNSTVMLEDIMDGYRGRMNALGALIVGADRPFALTSRTYSNRSPLGQTVPGTADFLDNSLGTIDNNAVAYIPGVINNARARTNAGFVAGSGGSTSTNMTVEVSVRNAAGGIVGTRRITVAPGQFIHVQFNIRTISLAQFDVGTLEFRIVEGEGTVVPYASVVDNATGEAAYIMGQFPNSTPTTSAFRTNLFRSLMERAQVR